MSDSKTRCIPLTVVSITLLLVLFFISVTHDEGVSSRDDEISNKHDIRTSIKRIFMNNRQLLTLPYKPLVRKQRQPQVDLAYHLFTPEKDREACGDWTYSGFLFPNDYNRYRYTEVNDSNLLHVKWDGNFPIPIHLPYSERCIRGRPPTITELNSRATPLTLLCTQVKRSKTITPSRKTIVLDFHPELYHWQDIIDDDAAGGLNIWHFHSHYFAIWLAIRLVDVTIVSIAEQNPNLKLSTILPDYDVIFLFPPEAYKRFNDIHADIKDHPHAIVHDVESDGWNSFPFRVTPEKLQELKNKFHGQSTPLIGLQSLLDGMSNKSKMIVASHDTKLVDLFEIMDDNDMESKAMSWLRPPRRDGYMWLLERYKLEDRLPNQGTLCHNNFITDYLKNFIPSTPVKYPNEIARHVCFVSRQMRNTHNHKTQKVKRRNLKKPLFNEVIKRLNSPVVLSPHMALKNQSYANQFGGYPLKMFNSTLTDQMRFVHDECAVLMGVHGAGLAHVMALRPGAHLLEIYAFREYTIFRNTAMLMNNVTYSTFRMNSTVVPEDNNNEHDLEFFKESDLEDLISLANQNLDQSIRNQQILLSQKQQ